MKKFIILLCLLPLVSGCATVVTGTTQKVPVKSEPSGANVNVNGKENHVTPVTLNLTRKTNYILIISKEGFKTAVVKITGQLNPLLAGEFAVPGGSVLAGADVVSGAGYDLKPDKVDVVLVPGQDEEIITYEKELKKQLTEKKDQMQEGEKTTYNFGHK